MSFRCLFRGHQWEPPRWSLAFSYQGVEVWTHSGIRLCSRCGQLNFGNPDWQFRTVGQLGEFWTKLRELRNQPHES